MTAKELAGRLNSRGYGSEMTAEEVEMAAAAGLLVMFTRIDTLFLKGLVNRELDSGYFHEIFLKKASDQIQVIPGNMAAVTMENRVRVRHYHDFPTGYKPAYLRGRKRASLAELGKIHWRTIVPDFDHISFVVYDHEDLHCEGCVIDVNSLV